MQTLVEAKRAIGLSIRFDRLTLLNCPVSVYAFMELIMLNMRSS